MKQIVLNHASIYEGHLILVNKYHPIRSQLDVGKLVTVSERYPDILLDRQAQTMLSQVLKDINGEYHIVPVSGYRSEQEQTQIFEDSLRENGEDFTKKYVALPGCSEHQTGLAIDLGENKPRVDFIRPDFPYSGICQQFRQMAVRYGFIERYPQGKQAITGIEWEPWHFRYVGYPHSMIMQNNGFTLEEYTDYTKQFPEYGRHLLFECDGQQIEIYYIPALGSTEIVAELPEDRFYQFSGNNVDGFIATLWRKRA